LPEIAHHVGPDRLTIIPVDDSTGRLRPNKTRIRLYNEEVTPFVADKALALLCDGHSGVGGVSLVDKMILQRGENVNFSRPGARQVDGTLSSCYNSSR